MGGFKMPKLEVEGTNILNPSETGMRGTGDIGREVFGMDTNEQGLEFGEWFGARTGLQDPTGSRKRAKKEREKELAEQLRPKTKQLEGVIDYEKIARLTKQIQSLQGKAVSPETIQAISKGAIEAQIAPSIAREERRMARDIEAQKLKIEEERRESEEKYGEMGFVGDVIGFVADVTVLCTEINRQGLLDKKVVGYANKYRKDNISEEVYYGYLIWATPLVEIMKKSKLVTYVVAFFWVPLSYELASRVSYYKGSLFGKLSYWGLSLFSRLVYRCKEVVKWQVI